MRRHDNAPQPDYLTLLNTADESFTQVSRGVEPYSGEKLAHAMHQYEQAMKAGQAEGVLTPIDSFTQLEDIAERSRLLAVGAADVVNATLFESRRDGYQKVVAHLGSTAIATGPTETATASMAGAKR